MKNKFFLKNIGSPQPIHGHLQPTDSEIDAPNKNYSHSFIELMKKAMVKVKIKQKAKKKQILFSNSLATQRSQHFFMHSVDHIEKRRFSLRKTTNHKSLVRMNKDDSAQESPKKQQQLLPSLQSHSPKLKPIRMKRTFNIKLRNINKSEIATQNFPKDEPSMQHHSFPTQVPTLQKIVKKTRKASCKVDEYLKPWETKHEQQIKNRQEF